MQRQFYEIEISNKRKVLFEAHKCSDMERIYAVAGITGEEPTPLLMHRVAKAGLCICIREVDGRKVSFEQLRSEFDELFTFDDMQILINGWTRVHYGNDRGNAQPVPVTMA